MGVLATIITGPAAEAHDNKTIFIGTTYLPRDFPRICDQSSAYADDG